MNIRQRTAYGHAIRRGGVSMLAVGVVGMGIRGRLFAEAARINSMTSLKAVCDLNKSCLEEAKQQFRVPGYESYAEMVEREGLDILCVSTPDFAHKEIVLEGARRKVNLFVEKPLATNTADCEEMRRAVLENGVKLTVAYTNRWNPPYKRASELIEQGELGEILSINARLNNTVYVPTKMLSWSSRSSPAWFLTSHPLDLALWYSKKRARSVYASGFKKVLKGMGIDTWDCIHSTVVFEDGTDAIFESCWVLPEGLPKIVDYKFQLIGTKGALNVDMQDQMIHFSNQDRTTFPDTLMVDLYGHKFGHNLVCFDSFVDSVVGDSAPLVSLEEAMENVRIVEAIHASLETGSVISL